MSENELWAPVPESSYEVSSLGRVRRVGAQKCLVPYRDGKKGYVAVSLHGKQRKIHQLVALAFLGARPDGCVPNHKNGIKNDNRASNLEWVTQSENCLHAFRELGRISSGGHLGKMGSLHHASRAVYGVNLSTGESRIFGSSAEAARHIGAAGGSVPRTCNGEYRSCKGWHFAYVDGNRELSAVGMLGTETEAA